MWATVLSWGAKAVPFLKSPKVVGSIVVAVASGLLYLYVDHLQDKVAGLQADNKLFVRYLNECQTANVENQKAVKVLQAANGFLADAVEVKEDDVRGARIDHTIGSCHRGCGGHHTPIMGKQCDDFC